MDLNQDLSTIEKLPFQWKMSFNPDLTKQATEVVFSRKTKHIYHPPLYFNNSTVVTSPIQKHLGLVLDKRLISKATKGTSLIKRLTRKSLLCIYKSFVRPYLDYADVIYDKTHSDSFCNKIEYIQYNSALAITAAIKGTSRKRLYQELGLESLRERRWYRRLVYFFKIVSGNSPDYLHSMLPEKQCSYNQEIGSLFRNFKINTEYFKNFFFPYCVNEWNKLGLELRNSLSISKFKKDVLTFIRPKMCPVYKIHDPIGLKLLTRLRVNLSHLREHKFRHNFLDTLNSLCSCSLEIESTKRYLLRCPFYTPIRKTLIDNITNAIGPISHLSDDKLVNLLLYGSDRYNTEQNSFVLKNTIAFLKSSERFYIPLL